MAGNVTAGLAESNGSLPPDGWLKSHAGWLPVHRDQFWAQRSIMSMGSLYILPLRLLGSGIDADQWNEDSGAHDDKIHARRPVTRCTT